MLGITTEEHMRYLLIAALLLFAPAALACDECLKQQLLEKIEELRLLAEQLPEAPVDPEEPEDPDPPVDPEDPEDPTDPEDPVSPDTLATVQPGLWEDVATWGGSIPYSSTHVTIKHDVTVTTGIAGRVDNHASLTLAPDGTLDLHGSYVAHDGSTTTATTGRWSMHVADDRDFIGNNVAPSEEGMMDFHGSTDIGLWFMAGSVRSFSAPEVTHQVAAIGTGDPVSIGYGVSEVQAIAGGTATLATEPVGWQEGDILVITSEKGAYKTATLTAIDGTTLTYTEREDGLPAGLVGNELQYELTTEYQPVIVNLSRRLVLDCPLVVDGDPHHRSFVDVHGTAKGEFRNVEFRNFSPRAKLGRYAVHHHKMGAEGHGNAVIGCSFWQDLAAIEDGSHRGSRAVAIHQTQGVECRDNVTLHTHGHTIFLEDFDEYDNQIIGNVVIGAIGVEELPVANVGPLGVQNAAHAYWMTAGNEVRDNTAIGCGTGLTMLESISLDGTKENREALVSSLTVVGSVNNRTIGGYGAWTDIPTRFDGFTALYCGNSAWRNQRSNVSGTVLNEPTLLMNGRHNGITVNRFRTSPGTIEINRGLICGPGTAIGSYTLNGRWVIRDTEIQSRELHYSGGFFHAMYLENCTIEVEELIRQSRNTPNDEVPSLIRMVNCTGIWLGEEYTEPQTADFVPYWIPETLPGQAGRTVKWSRRLDSQAPDVGFMETRVGAIRANVLFTDADSGGRFYARPENRTNPLAFEEVELYGGNPFGVPPGEYLVERTISGVSVTRILTIQSGQVTLWEDGELVEE